jgi:ribosome hibernation promoting factor
MKVQIRKRNVEVTDVLRAHVERRLGFALGRFGDRVARVVVRFSQTDGPAPAGSTRCEIEVGLRPKTVKVEDADVDRFAAVDHAVRRASSSVGRALELEHERDRT